MLNESVGDMTKTELRQFVKDVFEDEFIKKEKQILSKSDVKDMVRKMIKKHYRDIWEKSNIIIDNL